MLNADLFSFQGILKFLSISDVISLCSVNHEMYVFMRQTCKECVALKCIRSSEIDKVINRKLFPRLTTFPNIIVDNLITKKNASVLVNRWASWHECHISTKTHTRRALRTILLRIKDLRTLSMHFDIQCNHLQMVHNTPAMRSLLRRNPSLHKLTLVGYPPIKFFSPIAFTQLRSVVFDIYFRQISEIAQLIDYLPKTLSSLYLSNRNQCCTVHHFMPYFLYKLLQMRHLEYLALFNCITPCSLVCDAWSIILAFCQHTNVQHFRTEILRVDCICELLQNGVPNVQAYVAGCPPSLSESWLKQLPIGYRVGMLK